MTVFLEAVDLITQNIAEACACLKAGGLVAIPTETVYGLGADASNPVALKKVFQVKKRPTTHPLIVHIASINQLSEWALDINDDALHLAKTFWPGPLTLVLKKQQHVLDLVTGGQQTIALRIPRHTETLKLLTLFAGGLAAPSANEFTHLSPTTADAVSDELGHSIDLIFDGGSCELGLESTIIDLSRGRPILLRPGMITLEEIAATLNTPVATMSETKIRVPGQHALHYAPRTKTTLIHANEWPSFIENKKNENTKRHAIAFLTYETPRAIPDCVDVVMMPSESKAYAHKLYHTLRECDQQDYQEIIILNVPHTSPWAAIRDRLQKASFCAKIPA